MKPKLQVGSKICQVFLSFIFINQVLTLVQGGVGPYELDDKIDPSFDPKYLENFLEPDSEVYRNISCPKYWHAKDTLGILEFFNHTGEEHSITTEDGYIISIFRITPQQKNATPILFLHGFVASPETWIVRGNEDLPIMASDAGYDVWLGTYRGSHNGRRHINLTTQDEKFWDYTFHEHGYYDVTAMVDHILHTTGTQRLSAIGHSMGNAAFMTMLALRPEYNDKVQMFVGLAPYVKAALSPRAQWAIQKLNSILSYNKNTRSTDIFRRRKINPMVGACWSLPRFCTKVIPPGTDLEWKLLPVLMAYFPSGTSNKCGRHLNQLTKGDFLYYNYGRKGNLARYNSVTPPAYNLSNVRVPVSLYYGTKDQFVGHKNLKRLAGALPNVIKATIIESYNHIDFLFARTTRERLYNSVMADFRQYGGENQSSDS